MLPVDIHQMVANFSQLRGGGSAAIDPSPAFALGINAASEKQLLVGIKTVVL